MKAASMRGIILVILGVLAFAYQGITYTTHKKVLEIGAIQATETQHKTIPLPPIVAGVALVGGIALLAVGSKQA